MKEPKKLELKVYPALHEEAKEGWVWLPKLEGFCGRFVKIKNMENCKSIVCVRREIDDNFIIFYEHRSEYLKKRQKITKEYLRPDKSKSIVISEHYRRKLDISTMQTVKFEIEDILGWRSLVCFLKATCDHPKGVSTQLCKFDRVNKLEKEGGHHGKAKKSSTA